VIAEFRDAVLEDVRKEMNDLADLLANGRAVDFADYKRLVGVIHGLALAEELINARAKKVIEDDE
jgi:hypothetical protein